MERTLSQEEIDAVFASRSSDGSKDGPGDPIPYNFGRSDRIAKPQLKAIQSLHENFARDLAISLSAYLRDYVVVNLITVEQISFAEFLESLPSPTALVSLRVQPFSEYSVLELSPNLYSPVVQILVGGHAKGAVKIKRKLTEIEQSILDGLIRIVLNNLKAAWRTVADVEFQIDSKESDPQVFRILAPSDGILAIAIEVRVGENVGMMNIGVNSLTVARLRDRFDHNKSHRQDATDEEQAQRLELFKRGPMRVDALLRNVPFTVRDLMKVSPGDVLMFDVPVGAPLDLVLNGRGKFTGQIVTSGNTKRAFLVESLVETRAG